MISLQKHISEMKKFSYPTGMFFSGRNTTEIYFAGFKKEQNW